MKQTFRAELERLPVGARLSLAGDLTVDVPASAWPQLPSGPLRVELSGLTALDLNGSAQLLTAAEGRDFSVNGLADSLRPIFELAQNSLATPMESPPPRPGFVEAFGAIAGEMKADAVRLIAFHGELFAELARALARPKSVRWGNVFTQVEVAGVNAVPIASLVSFLVGLIIAFQAAMLMKIFGAEIYVADLIGLAVIRELGPLVSGIILAGRSGSAFSAELAAMKAAEEVDAISTMGLSPVRELALPRVLASLISTPMVTIIASFMGVLGGSFVLIAMGYAPGVFWAGAISQVSMAALFIGLFKSIVFGFTMSAVGCQRGLAAGDGPGAVGLATTSGVVANIVLIVALDSLFAVVFYVLGI